MNGNLEESIYMSPPEGFIEQDQEQMASYAISNERSGRCTIRSRNQIIRNRKNKTLAMSQASYIDKMLSRYKM